MLRSKNSVEGGAVLSIILICWIFKGTMFYELIKLVALAYSMMYLFTLPAVMKFRPKYEISLDLFLYSFPIQQIFSYYFAGQGPYWNFVESLAATAAVALFSALYLEKFLNKLADAIYSRVSLFCQSRGWFA